MRRARLPDGRVLVVLTPAPNLRGCGEVGVGDLQQTYNAAFEPVIEGAGVFRRPEEASEIVAIASEALLNAFRHAKATRVGARIRVRTRSVRIIIEDDGAGFVIPGEGVCTKDRHFGVQGMRERAARIGADLKMSSRVGVGTRVTLMTRDPRLWWALHSRH